MLKLKKKKNNLKGMKSFFIIFSSLLFFFFISLILITNEPNDVAEKIEDKKIEIFFDKDNSNVILPNTDLKTDYSYKENYIAVIEIPTIKLKHGLYKKNSKNNNVNKNIEILDDSSTPDVDGGNVILAGHSGTGRVAYFKNLIDLKYKDQTYIYYDGIKYVYEVVNIYEIEKTGYASIHRNINKNTLTMITCKPNTNKQIVIISELVNKENY